MEHKLWKKPTNFTAGTYPLTKKKYLFLPIYTFLKVIKKDVAT